MNILRVFFFLCQERKVGHTRNKSQQDDRTSLGGVKKKKYTHGNSAHGQWSQYHKVTAQFT